MQDKSIDVNYVADLARLELTEDECERFSEQLNKVIDFIKQLEKLETDSIEPMAHASPVYDVMRDDVSRPGFGTDTALLNAPMTSNNQFKVTRVVES
ncbi:MAG TPA: Asp-tRNA(Asn)/Glu-tRNA(Gln) amidotransferase subunit GatC [Verrucomicrobia bacterium]|nr:Asp-tRNA(Asn)/Glu-tRNA(Gln) amidotransferase subunit GatC [Verrucomicrobiales bacterium]HIL55767.1 Asp-tRNA(Asn)/Glu-tRNA(Gln) amidotransferase subunit GatC [Verrucomicrobiota bacterium]